MKDCLKNKEVANVPLETKTRAYCMILEAKKKKVKPMMLEKGKGKICILDSIRSSSTM